MRLEEFEWDDINLEHNSRHEVTFQEVEEACDNIPFVLRSKENRYLVYGQSDSGRYILTIISYRGRGVVRVITARDMTESEKKLYHRKRG